MIREQDLLDAIAECQGERNPNASTCIKLAAFYTIKEHLYPDADAAESALPVDGYSHAKPPVQYNSGSEFSQMIDGRNLEDVLPVIDELMETIRTLLPKLYDGVMRRLSR